ncbi:Rpc37p [Sugiyamaella lignohabitans]|uniref:Rpc37p n=1 Tax=Sugiyamaella lignohabitans TaxID=796027 RepID=A0A167BX72_9ASCO|nr:Rpc37p [Sugiyamaella lignohabitans]ANB10937.1 Rpc37p [Sugiyamaella lignohabitans]
MAAEDEETGLFMDDNESDDMAAVAESDVDMKDEEDPVSEAKQDAGLDDEDDPVVREFPVYSSQVLGKKLHILQYPTRSALRPLVAAQGTGIINSRLKPKSGIIEVDIPIDTSKFYDAEKGDRWNKVDRQTFSGVLKKGQGRYMAGVFRDGELHVSSIESVAQLRPQFKYFDKHVNSEKEANRMIRTDPTKPREARTIQMSAKSSGDFAPKYSGALGARKIADEESFVDIQWFDRDSNESWDMADKFVTTNKRILDSSTTLKDYTDKLQ